MTMITVVLLCLILSVSKVVSERLDTDSELQITLAELQETFNDQCTSVGLGPGATVDGSTITTHNNDCQECDIRISHVEAKDWPPGSKRPIFEERAAYPRYYELPADNVHGPDYLYGSADETIYKWPAMVPLMYIDQVEHTYAYTFGSYGIQNEKQLSMGESTCGARFVAIPTSEAHGKANFNLHNLNEIALERCETAVCAIKLMGELGTKYGFYGPGYENFAVGQGEAGEALIISDKTSTWMFHIAADDTGASCVWVAQRVPDDHIVAVANQFVIGEIDVSDPDNFLASDNVFEVAVRNNLWSPKSGIPFNFKRIYGLDDMDIGPLCTRRVWRVFTLAAPSLLPMFSPYTDTFGTFGFGPDGSQPYPFSVKPDRKQTIRDVMAMKRDFYEGTPFDQTTGPDAGPFGDPMRYMPTATWQDATNGVEWAKYSKGLGYPRVISLWRTAYSTVTQSRADLPDEVGAVTWLAQNTPHESVFVPVYANAPSAPSSLNCGTQYKLDHNSNYWAHSVVANYLARWFKFTIQDLRTQQSMWETKMSTEQPVVEAHAVELLSRDRGAALKFLDEYQEKIAVGVRDSWWEFFWAMAGKYRDMYKVTNIHVKDFPQAARYLTVPKWWLEMVGFWGPPGTATPGETGATVKPVNVRPQTSLEAYKQTQAAGAGQPYHLTHMAVLPPSSFPTAMPSDEKHKHDEKHEDHHHHPHLEGVDSSVSVSGSYSSPSDVSPQRSPQHTPQNEQQYVTAGSVRGARASEGSERVGADEMTQQGQGQVDGLVMLGTLLAGVLIGVMSTLMYTHTRSLSPISSRSVGVSYSSIN